MNIANHNRKAWNKLAKDGIRWSTPVSSKEIQAAKDGNWKVILTPNKSVPPEWFGDINGKKILCLASGGGQQAPILAAASANVTSFDNSDEQLALDQQVADRDGLTLKTIQGDMADLSCFPDNTFDLIFNPASTMFVRDVLPVWKECFRVLKPQGQLMSGLQNPILFMHDEDLAEESGILQVKYSIPYSDLSSTTEDELSEMKDENETLEFGHTLEDLLGGQLQAGFLIKSLYEDDWSDGATLLNQFTSTFLCTLAVKP